MPTSTALSRQRGLTLWGWLYVIATLGVIVIVGVKAVPIYMDQYAIQSTLTWASQQQSLRRASVHAIRDRIQRRFDSGYVERINARDIQIKRIDGGRRLSVEYKVLEPLFYNISLQFDFTAAATLPSQPVE